MSAIGIVFLYKREIGKPQEVSKNFSKYFSNITENLVKQDLLGIVELKEIIDSKRIYWGAIKENFNEFFNNEELIGQVAWKVFNEHSGIEPSEEVKILIYDENKSPWYFILMVCVIYN
ncbi:MAG: hypothetical protein ACFFD5_11800 [Candidatus Thorarchaeota archaeon]